MDLQEATITMAILLKNEAEYYNKYLKDFNPTTTEEKEEYYKRLEKFNWIKKNTIEFGNRLAAIPTFFDILESWKVYIIGKEGTEKDIQQKDNLTTQDIEDQIEKCSNLAATVKNFIKENGFIICDMGIGKDGWDIAVRCSENKSRLLCNYLYRKFYKAIQLEILFVSKRFVGHCLPGLYTWDDAIRLLNILDIKGEINDY